jgi:hypothetical protein
MNYIQYKTSWLEPESELYRLRDRRLSEKLVPTFADRGCYVVSLTDPYGRILDFLEPEPLLFLPSSSSILACTYDTVCVG